MLNVLPGSFAQRFKNGEKTIADHFDIGSVNFIDIIDFTSISARTTPVQMVRLQNEIFTKFDQVSTRYGMEKITTIRDC